MTTTKTPRNPDPEFDPDDDELWDIVDDDELWEDGFGEFGDADDSTTVVTFDVLDELDG
jgi:hypothetical protein